MVVVRPTEEVVRAGLVVVVDEVAVVDDEADVLVEAGPVGRVVPGRTVEVVPPAVVVGVPNTVDVVVDEVVDVEAGAFGDSDGATPRLPRGPRSPGERVGLLKICACWLPRWVPPTTSRASIAMASVTNAPVRTAAGASAAARARRSSDR